jgi:hypothetical protein
VGTTEELLERKSSGFGLENRDYGRYADYATHTTVHRRLCAEPLIESALVSRCWMWMLCPEFDAISPDGFEDGFVEKKLVG